MSTKVLAGLIQQLLGQLEDEPPPLPMPPRPFEPIDRIPWALEYGVQSALPAAEWAKFKAAMPPSEENDDLLEGVVEGVGAAINDIVKEHLDLAKMALQFTVEFYSVVYDVQLWGLVVTFWLNPGSTPQGVATHIQQKHPALWTAIREYPKLEAKIQTFIDELTSDDAYGTSTWDKAEEFITDLMCDLLFGLGRMLKEDAAAIIAKKGDAEAQGKIIGRRVGRAIIEAVLLALDLFSLVRGAAKELGEAAMKASRTFFKAPELARVAAKVEKVTPGINTAARTVANSARKQVEQAYQNLAHRIAPYKVLKKETGAFNKGVRHVYGYSIYDVDYVAVRLDAHHIMEDRFYSKFSNEFRQKLGWNSADDMDTIALHTEWHIRSGDNMSMDLGLRGAEGEPSLTKKIIDGIAAKEPQGGFANLRQLIDAYEEVYIEYAPMLYVDKLQGWFDAVKLRVP